MERPVFDYIPTKPTEDSPAVAGTCGREWYSATPVRAPYKKVDKFVNNLPPIHHDAAAMNDDINVSIPVLVKRDFQDDLRDAIRGGEEILDNYVEHGYMDEKNRKAIQSMFDRAAKYLENALSLQLYWAEHYTPDPQRAATGWPLEQEEYGNGCDGKYAPEEGEAYTFTAQGADTVAFTCPSWNAFDDHRKDRKMFAVLMDSALVNCRCAQEAAAAVGTFYRNKEAYNEQYGGMKLLYDPKKKKGPSLKVAPREPTPPGIPEIGEEMPAPEAPAKKKKDNTLLIAGAAALGILLLKGRG